MEVLRCFNCDHTGRRHEEFFNITKIHPSFAEKADSESEEQGHDKFLKENAFLVCCDCVYDRLQECHSCAKKAPLCMFKIAEWFTDKKNRNCIDCAATLEALALFQTGYHSSVIIRQCSVCRHFKYLPSFINWRKHQPHETLKDCFECQLRRDIVQYKRKVRDRYEEKLQQEPVLGDDIQPSRTGGKERFEETLAQQGATYASVVSKGFSDGKSSYTTSDEGHLRTKQNTALLNAPIESGQHRGKSLSTGLEESFCTKVLEALKTSFNQLEEKTKLELKLLQSDPHFWKVALRDKLLRVSQLFSSQATDQIQFNDAESRWAYLGTYTAAHATLIHAVVTSGQFEPLTEFVKKSQNLERVYIGVHAKLFLLSKFVSAVQNLPGSFQYLLDIVKRASPGSLFLFVDNAHIQTKYFIEDLIFPSHDSTEQEEYKENKSFRLYTTYAELNSDREEGLKSAAMCEWVSLISYWLDRNPILDLRVNIHLAVKKG
ncbi:hypothetical protein AWC38_SpisGene4303 [Stylophora pistillata]|uniref:Uncharacterized protein n=1 Tax=Stylophora pistillata TaxID=50429 RepID=A0A2B4SP51_STYPI|nr:hypothetical protein AWC38_SpisGene4303 [Stylophora pistillata]